MKNFLIGCGVIILIIIIAIGALVCYGVRKVKQLDAVRKELVAAYDDTNNMFEFTAPEGRDLSPDRLRVYIEVRKSTMPVINEKADLLSSEDSGLKILSLFLEGLKEIGLSHADALIENQMSLDEYRWISEQVMTVLSSLQESNEQIKEVVESIKDKLKYHEDNTSPNSANTDEFWVMYKTDIQNIPVKNVEEVIKYKEELIDSANMLILDSLLMEFESFKWEEMKNEQNNAPAPEESSFLPGKFLPAV